MSRRAQLLFFVITLLIAAIAYWQSLPYEAAILPNGARYTPSDCWFEHNKSVRIECGYMTTRASASSKATFDLPVVVLRRSVWRNSKAPMLHIAGGPGGAAYLDTEVMKFWIQNFIDQDWGVDFVLYDQRGAGLSKPSFKCQNSQNERLDSLQQALTASQDNQRFSEQMQSCYQQLIRREETKTHLGLISTDDSVNDIIDLHDLLKVDQWILMGVSYGTRLALETVRKFPEYIKSMVLDSVYPPRFDGFETMVENGFKAIERLMLSCHTNDFCDEQYPMLTEQLYQTLLALQESPLLLSVPHEKQGKPERVLTLTPHRLVLLLDYASYDSDILTEVPAAISAVWQGESNNPSLLKLAGNYLEIELFDEFSEPVYLITECRENGHFDMTSLMKKMQEYREGYPMLDWSERAVFDSGICDKWQNLATANARDFRKPVYSEVPALIVAGGLDSITPPDWGRALSKQLPNSQYLEYPGAAHSVLTSSVCSNDEVQLFLNPGIKKTAFCSQKERLKQRTAALIDWTY